MAAKGICPVCQSFRWLGGRDRRCKPCAYPVGECTGCQKTTKIYVDDLCYLCYQDRQVREKISHIERGFSPASQYNRDLFDLYLTYIRRYLLYYHHHRQAKRLRQCLEEEKFPRLTDWAIVKKMARCHSFTHRKYSDSGNAILKVGYLLQELGVLGPRREETQLQVEALIDQINPDTQHIVKDFVGQLKKSNRADRTITRYLVKLKNLSAWLKVYYPNDRSLLTLNPQIAKDHLDFLSAHQITPSYIRQTHVHLNCFYRFCVFKKKMISNPLQGIVTNREASHLTICSEDQVKSLAQFAKNSRSDPEQAFLICLILFFALTLDDITYATLQIESDSLCVILRRKPRTKGRRFYNRDQILKLPKHPAWFFRLQKRFYQRWKQHLSQIKSTYPHPSLILPKHCHYNRPMSKDFVRIRIYKATLCATGKKIPPSVLRQSCGHLYTQHQDASLLTRMGWSPQFAFHYTWLPRRFVSSNFYRKTKLTLAKRN